MVNHVKPGYVNPLTITKSSKNGQTNSLLPRVSKKVEKRQSSLEAQKQSIQNSLLLMKGTSGDTKEKEKTIEFLEQKLKEITLELKTNRQKPSQEAPGNVSTPMQSNKATASPADVHLPPNKRFDRLELTAKEQRYQV